MEYNQIFKPSTLAKLNKKSQENLKSMLGDKTLMQTMIQSQELLDDISKAEAPYKDQLEQLAIQMIEDLYPIVEEEGIKLDAKIVPMSDIHSELDEIKINKPISDGDILNTFIKLSSKGGRPIKGREKEWILHFVEETQNILGDIPSERILNLIKKNPTSRLKEFIPFINEEISPESRRRIINGITQGAALRGAFSFYLFKDYLDAIDPTLIDKYNQIMKNSFGIYDDDNAIAMLLSLLAQGHKAAGGSSKVIINEIKVKQPKLILECFFDESWVDFLKQNPILFKMLKNNILSMNGDNIYDKEDNVYNMANDFSHWGGSLGFNGLEDWNKDKLKQFIQKLLTPKYTKDYENTINVFNKAIDNTPCYSKKYKQKIIQKQGEKLNNPEWIKNELDRLNEQQESGITIRARAICFPMLVHEIIKGLYELVSLQGFKGDKEANQGVVDKVDTLSNELHDIKFGKHIFDALNDIFADSPHSDPRIREFFFSEVYQLEDGDFIDFVENAINEELSPKQKRWVDSTLKDISFDLKADDYDQEGIDEIKVNNPESIKFENLKIGDVYSFKIKNGNMEKLIIVNKTPNELNPYSKPAIVGNRNINMNNEDDDDNDHYLTISKDDIINIKNI